jgi:hypothetical protein
MLERIRPDVVLLEFDSSFFDAGQALWPRFAQLTLETRAVTRYANRHVETLLRPYDIEGRNAYFAKTQYFDREAGLHQRMFRLKRDSALSAEADALYETMVSYGSLRDVFATESPAILNARACDAAMERKEHYSFEGISRIIELTRELSDFQKFWTLATEFWKRRNDAMLVHIRSIASASLGKRIVVLCGFEHGYYLRRALAEDAARATLILGRP